MPEYGYRWVTNKISDIFIVKLETYNSYRVSPEIHPLEFYTTDCLVLDIYRLRDGRKFKAVHNGAWYYENYDVGVRKAGKPIFFCKSVPKLLRCQEHVLKEKRELYDIIMGNIEYMKLHKDTESRERALAGIRHFINWGKPRNPEPDKLSWLSAE